MKRAWACILVSVALLTQRAEAFFLDQEETARIELVGDVYEKNGVMWQPLCYDEPDVGLVAAMPGSPISGSTGEWIFAYSDYNQSEYAIFIFAEVDDAIPETEIEFLEDLRDIYPGDTFYSIPHDQPHLKYIAESPSYDLDSGELDGIFRFYCSHNQVYIAHVIGEDFSLAEAFFETVRITK